MSLMDDSVVLITGGTGTFGKAFLLKCVESNAKEIRIFSRDEKKQYDMAQEFAEHKNIRFFIGDVRDKASVDKAMQGVDYVFHAAAMKQVPSCEQFPTEAIKTNVNGSDNVLRSAIENKVKKVVCLSTDKAVGPVSCMGMTKAFMEKIALRYASENTGTNICITRFGNLIASRGSVVPLFLSQVETGMPITVTEPDMTRYLMTAKEAVELVAKAFEIGENGQILIKPAKACIIRDLVSAIFKYKNLPVSYPVECIGARPGEKEHEALISQEESERAHICDGYVVVNPVAQKGDGLKNAFRSSVAQKLKIKEIIELIQDN